MKPRLKPDIDGESARGLEECQPSTSAGSASDSDSDSGSEDDDQPLLPSLSSSSSSGDDNDDSEYEDEENPRAKRRKVVVRLDNDKEVENRKTKKERKSYECPFCGYLCTYPSKLKIHLENNHYGNLRFSCPIDGCDAAFAKYQELREHKRDNHPIMHNCLHCSYTNKSKAWVRRHTEQNHVNGIVCTIIGCGVKIAKNRMKKHIRECHTEDIGPKKEEEIENIEGITYEKCPHCDYRPDESNIDSTMKANDINMHIERIHLKKSRVCPLGCGKMLKMDELDEHLKWDHARPNQGILSEETASTSATSGIPNSEQTTEGNSILETEDRSDDQLTENDEEESDIGTDKGKKKAKNGRIVFGNQGTFECSKCDKKFIQKDYLRKHVARVHDKRYKECREKRKSKKFVCEWSENATICGKTFPTKGLFDDHINVHLDIKPYKCNTCDQYFHARARFAVHLSKYHQTSIRSYSFVESSLPVILDNPEVAN